MSVNTEVDEGKNLIIHHLNESISVNTITDTIQNTLANPKYKIGMNAIWVIEKGADIEMNSDDAQIISDCARKAFDQSDISYKLALVAFDDLAYGMSRVYEGWSNDRPVTINTFRKLEDALDWIE